MKEMDNVVIDGLDETYATNVDVDDVLSPSVMLVDFVIDGSGSMSCYEITMRECLEHYKNAICNSKQADEMLVSKTIFSSTIETGGYVAPEDFNTDYDAQGCTKLYDAIIDRKQRMLDYMEQLKDNGTNARACLIILSDGKDYGSKYRASDAREAILQLISKEITVAFIAFGQLFARKVKEYYDKGECINEDNFIKVVDEIFKQMLNLCSDTSFIFQNYCFTILVCFELEDEFVVYSCGDGYIIKENEDGITFEQLDDGEYPCYYIYNYIEDKTSLTEYTDGVTFKVKRFSKEEYLNIGVATDGLRYYENLFDVEKNNFLKFLHEGKEGQIEKLINRNNNRNGMFHDDISICF